MGELVGAKVVEEDHKVEVATEDGAKEKLGSTGKLQQLQRCQDEGLRRLHQL